MNRRGFLTACASLLPLPAFVKAASLWLPPERPRILEPVDFQAEKLMSFCIALTKDAVTIQSQEWSGLSGITFQSFLRDDT